MSRCLAWLCLLLSPCAFGQRGTGEIRLSVGTPPARRWRPAPTSSARPRIPSRASIWPTDGRYVFKNLPFGIYRLLVSRNGFVSSYGADRGAVGAAAVHGVTLGIQPVATELKVTEADTLIDPDRTGGSYYVGARQVQGTGAGQPGRDMIDLVAQQPGWILEANGVLHPRESEYATQYVVNGFPVQDNRSPAFAPGMEFDDIQSLKAYTERHSGRVRHGRSGA